MPQFSRNNPYLNLLLSDPDGNYMKRAQEYEIQHGSPYAAAMFQTGGAFNAVTPKEPSNSGIQIAPRPVDPGIKSKVTDFINQTNNTANPQATRNTDELNKYLTGSSAPQAAKATMAENRYGAGLTAAEQRLKDLINNPGALQDSASYKFRVNQGQEALQRNLGARGMLASGNRLTELTKYGQDMASQEYEAENKRRMDMYNSVSGNYNADQTNNISKFNVDQMSNDRQYATAADLYKSKGATLADLYKTDVGAGTARANTLADLYRTDVNASVQQTSPTPWWVGKYDQYGRPIA